MINGVERIPSNKTYSKTTPAVDDQTVFTAKWWNTISEAVENAHSKINGMTATNNASLTGTAVTVESTDTNVDITSSNSITITAQQDIDFFNEGGINGVTLSDIITVVEYFKNNTEDGPFAATT